MRLLLDSNIVIYILRKRDLVLKKFGAALGSSAILVSSDVVDYEVRRYFLLKGATRQLQRYEDLTRDWNLVSLGHEDWRTAARLWAELHQAGRSIEDRDLLIAVSALKANATLVTNNVRHFENLEVPLLNWAES